MQAVFLSAKRDGILVTSRWPNFTEFCQDSMSRRNVLEGIFFFNFYLGVICPKYIKIEQCQTANRHLILTSIQPRWCTVHSTL